MQFPIYLSSGPVLVDPNSNDPRLRMESHVHPFHAIINAYDKFKKWNPLPKDAATQKIIESVNEIWDALNSPPPSDEFLKYRERDDRDYSGLGPPSETRSGSRGSGSKRGERNEDDNVDPPSRRRRMGYQQQNDDEFADFASLESSYYESPPSPRDSNFGVVRDWQVKVTNADEGMPDMTIQPELEDEGGIGSPKVTEYKSWEPEWDTRWFDTSRFSSNDWALLRKQCNLTEGV